MRIPDFLGAHDILVDVPAPSKARLLRFLAERAGQAVGLPAEALLAALERREALGSTGIGSGVAIPHTSGAGLSRPHGLLCRTTRPIDFDAVDEVPVDVVFLLLTPADATTHLKVLSLISRQLRGDKVLEAIRRARTAQDIFAIMSVPA